MQKYILLALTGILTLPALAYFKQVPAAHQAPTNAKLALCHRWQLTHMEAQGKRLALPSAGTGASFMTLKPDGTFVELSDGLNSFGTWNYVPQTKTLTTVDKAGREDHKVLKMSAEQLVIRDRYEGMMMNMVFKRIH